MSDAARASGAGEVLCGVTLQQFAGVLAAVGEGISLEEVLSQERIDREAWPQAERAWRAAIAGSHSLQIELVQKKRVAEDALSRRVEPIDADPGAWVGLLGALATAEDPSALVERLGITMNDVARIGRSWRRKCESDAEVAKKLEELAPDAKPPANVKAAPLELRPFPWSPASGPSDERPAAAREAVDGPSQPAAEPGREPKVERASYQIAGPTKLAPPEPPLPSYLVGEASPPAGGPSAPLAAGAARPAPATFAHDPFSGTAALPSPEVLERLIAESSPEAALAKAGADPRNRPLPIAPKEEHVGSGTALTPIDLAELAAPAMPFRDAEKATPSSVDTKIAEPGATAESRGNAPSRSMDFRDDPFSGTAALPTPDIVERLIAESQPRAAMSKHEAAARSPSRAKDAPPPEHVSTGTEAVDPEAVRVALAAYAAKASTAAPSNAAARGSIDIATLAAIAVDIRGGTWPARAVAARGLTDGAWRAAQASVVSDPAKRRAFEAAVAELLRGRSK
jgi:hypothetical protein